MSKDLKDLDDTISFSIYTLFHNPSFHLARTLRPGPRALQRMSTKKLIVETIYRYREYNGRWPRKDRDALAAEYQRRNLPITAHTILAKTEDTTIPEHKHSWLDIIHHKYSTPAIADVERMADLIIKRYPEEMKETDSFVNSSPSTPEDTINDARDLDMEPKLIEARDILASLDLPPVDTTALLIPVPDAEDPHTFTFADESTMDMQ